MALAGGTCTQGYHGLIAPGLPYLPFMVRAEVSARFSLTASPGSGRDNMLRSFDTSRLVDGKELVLTLQSRDARRGEEPNRAPRVPAGWTTEITFDEIAGLGPGCFRHFASWGSQLQRKVLQSRDG
jgi:hypothetical protein